MKAKTQFELWLVGCREFDTLPWQLETCHDMKETGLFMTKRRYFQKYREYYEQPVYHVWFDGKCKATTTNQLDAYAVWNNLIART